MGCIFVTQPCVLLVQLLGEACLLLGVHEALRYDGVLRRIFHPDHDAAVNGGNLQRHVHLGRCCSTHHYGQVKSGTFHLRRHVHHLFQARRDKTAQTYHVCLLRHGFLHNLLGRNHYAKVHDVVVVARHHHRHDVLADVVYVALDGCHQHLAGCGRSLLLVGFDVGLQYCHSLLHRSGVLHHLREEHLAATEQLAHRVHAVHERAFYDVHGLREGGQGFLNVFLHIFRHTLHQRC